MQLCGRKLSAFKSIILRLRKKFRRSRQAPEREMLVTSRTMVDGDQISQTAESPVDEDFEPRPTDAIRQDEPLLPPNCDRLCPEDIEILGTFPDRAGVFTDVWEGSLAGDRVVIKSYRLYSATDFTQARIVRFRWYPRTLRYADPPSATEAL